MVDSVLRMPDLESREMPEDDATEVTRDPARLLMHQLMFSQICQVVNLVVTLGTAVRPARHRGI